MTKYCARLVGEMEAWISRNGLVECGGAKMKDFTSYFKIDFKSYKNWKGRHPDFAEMIDRAKATFRANLAHDLVNTLADAAKGGFKEEEDEQTRYRPGGDNQPRIVEMVKSKHKRFVKPDIGAAIFLLTNLAPDQWQNRQRNDIAVKKEDEKPMSIEEINAEIERLEKLTDKD